MAKKIRKRRANYFDNGGFSWQKGAGFGKNMGNAFNSGALNSAIGAASSMAGQGISGGLSSGAGNAMQGLGSIANAIPGPWGAVASAGLNILGGLTNKLFGSTINEQAVANFENQNAQQGSIQFSANNTTDLVNQGNFGLLSAINKSDVGKDGIFSNKAQRTTDRLNRERNMANAQAIGNYFAAAQNVDAKQDALALANYAAYGGPLTMRYTGTMSPFGNTFANGGKIYIKPENRGKFTALKERTGKSATWFKEHGTPAQKKMATFALNSRHWSHADGGPIKKKTFEDWYKTIPADRNDTTSYNLRRAYELAPYNELEAWRTSSIKDLEEGKNHLRSVYLNPNTGVYEFMKSKNHPFLHFETDWYNSNDPEAVKFRRDYDLDMSGDYYKYVPKKKAFGGNLITNGAEWDNGLTIIGNGGTHEENPMEGVQMGMDAQGVPNLVEEGEVIFNDYVFSDRMNVPNSMRSSLGLSKGKDLTFAKAAKKLGKEAEERPNDPISRRGLMSSMTRLQQAQETVRQQNQVDQEGVQYAHGGRMGNLFDGTGPEDNYLEARNFYENYSNNIYGKNPYIVNINPYKLNLGFKELQNYSPGNLAPVPDDNELLDIARVREGEKPKGKVTPVLEPLIEHYSNSNNTNTNNNSNLTWLRYAPVVGAAIGLGQNIFSKPDYSSSDAILNAANEAGRYTPIGFNPLGDYLTYRPFDRNYYINKLNAQSGATRRAIVNQSAGNRATALAGLLAADYNIQGNLGNLARQAEEYNLGQRERVATFNRGTNQFNSEMGLKAAMANQEASLKARSQRLSGVAQAMQVRDAVDARRASSMSANLTNLFNSIGDIGKEAYSRNMIISNPALYYTIGSDGTISYKGGFSDLSESQQAQVRDAAEADKARRGSKAKGGYLTIKKK